MEYLSNNSTGAVLPAQTRSPRLAASGGCPRINKSRMRSLGSEKFVISTSEIRPPSLTRVPVAYKRRRVTNAEQRVAANYRERKRMMNLNAAFSYLRGHLPVKNNGKRMSFAKEEDDVVEADAGTPKIPGSGDAPPVFKPHQRFPWETKKDSSGSSGGNGGMSHSGHQDPSDPVLLLAGLTMMLANRECVSMGVPPELRGIIKEQVEKTDGINLNAKFFQRLADLNIISKNKHQELTRLTDFNRPKEIIDDLLEYVYRKGMFAVLNFTKVLYEDEKFEVVRKVVEHIRLRQYFTAVQPRTAEAKDGGVWMPESTLDKVDVKVKPGQYRGDSRSYKMSSKPRGHVLIINNENFKESGGLYSEREGTQVDGDKLATLFVQLSFQIYKDQQFWNKTQKEMEQLIAEFAQYEDHRNVDACVVCILSHGTDKGRIAGVDGEHTSDEKIHSFFRAEACPHLANKPKIFLFVACRGSASDNGMFLDHPPPGVFSAKQSAGQEMTSPTDFRISSEVVAGDSVYHAVNMDSQTSGAKLRAKKIPNEVDFISIYAAVPGYRSLRSKRSGTWFIQDFVDVVASEAYLNDLVSMVCEVNNRLSERTAPDGEMQSLHCATRLRKSLFFNPGF